jgi:hypothetical protein
MPFAYKLSLGEKKLKGQRRVIRRLFVSLHPNLNTYDKSIADIFVFAKIDGRKIG